MAAIRNNVCKDLKFAEDPETVYHAILTAVLRHMPGFDTRIVDNKNNFKAEEFVVTYYRSAKQAINQYRQYSQKRVYDNITSKSNAMIVSCSIFYDVSRPL